MRYLKNEAMTFQTGDLSLVWFEGALVLSAGDVSILLDAPSDVSSFLEATGVRGNIRGILCSSGLISSVGGLLGLLSGITADWSHGSLPIYAPVGDDRLGLLVEAWTRGWPNGVPVSLDTLFPGASFSIGPIQVDTLGIQCPERLGVGSRMLEMKQGVSWRIQVGETTVLWAKACAPQPTLSSWCKGATLAILELGADMTRNAADKAMVATSSQLSAYGMSADELWLVSHDGRALDSSLLN